MRLAECRIGIIGLGLMGGSLAEALRGHCRQLLGADRDAGTRRQARQLGTVNVVGENGMLLAEADLAVLAVPVRASLDLMDKMGAELPAPPRLLDLGSTKVEVAKKMERLPEGVEPIGGHPMCGKEMAGFAARDRDLFQGSRFVLTPLARTGKEVVTLLQELVGALGAKPITMTPEDHDRLVAVSSHLPYLAAAALVRRGRTAAAEDSRLVDLMASGFRDSTRLAASDPDMMLDILLTNRSHLLREVQSFQRELACVEGLVRRGGDELAQELAALAATKEKWTHSSDPQEAVDEPQAHWPGP